jgi:hypothetical protein
MAGHEALKYRLHRLLAQDAELRELVEREAIGTSALPRSGLELSWREGRRSLAAEWLSLYREVEDERTRAS